MTTRVALVTGGTGGIGTAICRHLATLGHKVATNYRDEARAKAWQDAQRKEGFDFALAKGDVADAASAEAMVCEVEKQLGISRGAETDGLSGWDAVRLWREYQAGRDKSLETLVEYNREDVVNLERLAEIAYERLRGATLLGAGLGQLTR